MTINLTLPSPPRTKKAHPQLIMGRAVVLPSEQYTAWLKSQLQWKAELKAALASAIPITTPVSITALIYREARTGDWTGYVDAIADALQSDVWQCQRPEQGSNKCRKKMVTDQAPTRCLHCGWPMPKRTRKGLGIISDDKLIQHWDGTRLLVDKANPRVELAISVIPTEQPALFESSEVLEAV